MSQISSVKESIQQKNVPSQLIDTAFHISGSYYTSLHIFSYVLIQKGPKIAPCVIRMEPSPEKFKLDVSGK